MIFSNLNIFKVNEHFYLSYFSFSSSKKTRLSELLLYIAKTKLVLLNMVTVLLYSLHCANAKIISLYGETEYFEILAGVLQGDTLASHLLKVVLNCTKIHSYIYFAVDIALLCKEVEGPQ